MARPGPLPRAARLPRTASSSMSTATPTRPPPSKKRAKPPASTGTSKKPKIFTPPPNWKRQYDLIAEMRSQIPAPVDTMGCAVIANPSSPPKTQRFQTLVALMLSSQTLDTVTAPTIRNLQRVLPNGLDLQDILEIDQSELDKLIGKVGFHTKKAGYLKRAAEVLRDEYASDIPGTVEGLCKLPGVGEKMAHLCMTAAWKQTMGIGVDTHVHRIANLLNWVNTNTPEKTRVALESWLPAELWGPVNPLLVGFGQTVCLPRAPKCGECRLAEEGFCPYARKGGLKAWKERERKKAPLKAESEIAKREIIRDAKIEDQVSEDNAVAANLDMSNNEAGREEMASPIIKTEGGDMKITEPFLKPVKEEEISGHHIEHFSRLSTP